MCAQAIAHSHIPQRFFGAYDPKGGGVEHGPCIFQQPTCHHKIHIIGGVQEQKAQKLLKDFFKKLR